jgi:putative ABC transport system ATP-binding protein
MAPTTLTDTAPGIGLADALAADAEKEHRPVALMSLTDIRKTFSTDGTAVEALRGLDLEVREGEFLSITGESGSGKSTLLSILGGITPPTSGLISVDDIDIYALPIEQLADFRREYIGFVFQQFHLIPYLTAAENVMLPFCVTGRKDMKDLALGALERVGLGHKADRLPSQLSGGEQQRVAVARALVNEPPIILADEPTGNLDTKTGSEIFGLFEELNRAGETIILVTHNLDLAERTHRMVRMKDGLIESVRERGL